MVVGWVGIWRGRSHVEVMVEEEGLLGQRHYRRESKVEWESVQAVGKKTATAS